MVTLQERLDNTQQLPEIAELLNAATTKITFWGSRVVEVQGATDCVSIDEIARKVLDMRDQLYTTQKLTLADRAAGIKILYKLSDLYVETDRQVDEINPYNIITRIAVWVRSFFQFERDVIQSVDAEGPFRTYPLGTLISQGCIFDEGRWLGVTEETFGFGGTGPVVSREAIRRFLKASHRSEASSSTNPIVATAAELASLQLFTEFFEFLKWTGNPNNKATLDMVNQYISTNMLTYNGDTITGKGVVEFHADMEKKQRAGIRFGYDAPAAPRAKGNEVIHRFRLSGRESNGNTRLFNVKLTVTFKKGKIDSYREDVKELPWNSLLDWTTVAPTTATFSPSLPGQHS